MTNTFVKWWVTFSIMFIVVGSVLFGGLGQFILESDKTYLSWLIISILLAGSLFAGYSSYGKYLYPEDLDLVHYFIDTSTSLGLLGTIIGLIMMIVGTFSNLDVSSQESVKTALLSMSSGIGTALVTTLVGLVCAMLLKLQMVILVGGSGAK